MGYTALQCDAISNTPGVARDSLVRINNHEVGAFRRGLTARPVSLIVELTQAEVGNVEEYTVHDENCEEFATRMRYGSGWSSQVCS